MKRDRGLSPVSIIDRSSPSLQHINSEGWLSATLRYFVLFGIAKLFSSLNRSFTELFEEFGELESGFAGTSTSSFVTFLYLKFSVHLELLNLCIDFLY